MGGGSQPLVALCEAGGGMLGACVVDVALCSIALSQWQEVDAARSLLQTLLLQSNPAEVCGPWQEGATASAILFIPSALSSSNVMHKCS